MNFFNQEPDNQQFVAEVPDPGLGDFVSANISAGLDMLPTLEVGKLSQLRFSRVDFTEGLWSAKPMEKIPAEEAQEKYGLNGALTFDKPIPERTAKLMMEWKKEEIERNFILEAGSINLGRGALGLGTTMATQLLDPFNIASMFIPIVSEARFTKWAGEAGKHVMKARMMKGMIEGAVGAALVEPFVVVPHIQRQSDYGLAESAQAVGFGAVLGGALHVGAGKIGDVITSRKAAKIRANNQFLAQMRHASEVIGFLDKADQMLLYKSALSDWVSDMPIETPSRLVAAFDELTPVQKKRRAAGKAYEQHGPRIERFKDLDSKTRQSLRSRVSELEGEELLANYNATRKDDAKVLGELIPKDVTRQELIDAEYARLLEENPRVPEDSLMNDAIINVEDELRMGTYIPDEFVEDYPGRIGKKFGPAGNEADQLRKALVMGDEVIIIRNETGEIEAALGYIIEPADESIGKPPIMKVSNAGSFGNTGPGSALMTEAMIIAQKAGAELEFNQAPNIGTKKFYRDLGIEPTSPGGDDFAFTNNKLKQLIDEQKTLVDDHRKRVEAARTKTKAEPVDPDALYKVSNDPEVIASETVKIEKEIAALEEEMFGKVPESEEPSVGTGKIPYDDSKDTFVFKSDVGDPRPGEQWHHARQKDGGAEFDDDRPAFFMRDKDTASSVIGKKTKSPEIITAELDLKNPIGRIEFEKEIKAWYNEIGDARAKELVKQYISEENLRVLGIDFDAPDLLLELPNEDFLYIPEVRKMLSDKGYDGYIGSITGGMGEAPGVMDMAVVWKKDQIKPTDLKVKAPEDSGMRAMFEEMTTKELKDELKDMGIQAKGPKKDLIEQLMVATREAEEAAGAKPAQRDITDGMSSAEKNFFNEEAADFINAEKRKKAIVAGIACIGGRV